MRYALRLATAFSVASHLVAQQAPTPKTILPAPTGGLGVGRITRYWVDSTRAEFLDPAAAPRRELMVDVWYPAARTAHGEAAAYLPLLSTVRRTASDSLLRRRYRPAYAAMEAGRLTTHAIENAPAQCPRGGCPMLIFSHGGGVDRSSYTAQFEDLASHGYVVASIAHSFDTHAVIFPDGRVIRNKPAPPDTLTDNPALPVWRRELAREERSQAYVRRVIAVAAADIRFVLDRLSSERGAPFPRQLDLSHVGALGHSLGGEAAALACQLDSRFKACLNQDGAMHNLPFSRDSAGRTMRQPFMYFTRFYPRPRDPDSVLAMMQISRAQMDSLTGDIAAGPYRLLRDVPGGAYLVTLTIPNASHMAFSDEPLIEARDDSVNAAAALLALRKVNRYTRAFFDHTLLGRRDTPLDRRPPADSAMIKVEAFKPK
jgi:dienelactone hydrolase